MRLDDLCPTMDWAVFDRFEAVMDRHGVRPLVAVIPDNQDPTFHVSPGEPRFWERVRAWQAKGWSIGLHGFQHRYVTADGGLLGLSGKSEFAGLPYAEQLEKLEQAVAIFQRERVEVDAWVAPSHAFDRNTLLALKTLGIRTISDGLALRPYLDDLGHTWVPQQFALIHPMPFGTWTFCYHLDDFESEATWEDFEAKLARIAPQMTTLSAAVARCTRTRSLLDRGVALARHALNGARRLADRF